MPPQERYGKIKIPTPPKLLFFGWFQISLIINLFCSHYWRTIHKIAVVTLCNLERVPIYLIHTVSQFWYGTWPVDTMFRLIYSDIQIQYHVKWCSIMDFTRNCTLYSVLYIWTNNIIYLYQRKQTLGWRERRRGSWMQCSLWSCNVELSQLLLKTFLF